MKSRQYLLRALSLPLSLMLLSPAANLASAAPAAPAANSAAAKKAVKKSIKKSGKAGRAAPAMPVRKIDYTGQQLKLAEWPELARFADEMVARHGFARDEIDRLVDKLRFVDSAVQLVKPAPRGIPKNWKAYRGRFVEPIRIGAGVRFWNQNAAALARAEMEFGVPAEIIVGIIGVETIYGRDTGRFRVMDVLATLAFAYPDTPNRATRMAFFRSELANTLLLSRQFQADPFSLLGSFAGAVGMTQFMPGNVLKYGVDFDGDGDIDLARSPEDAIGSVAHFLAGHGWRRGQPGAIVVPARVDAGGDWQKFIGAGLAAQFSQQELAQAGVSALALPAGELYGLVDLQNGYEPDEYWLGSNNFYAITQYNRSFFYAMTVIELGRAVRQARQA